MPGYASYINYYHAEYLCYTLLQFFINFFLFVFYALHVSQQFFSHAGTITCLSGLTEY